jgi:hypothetical protein
MYKLLIGGIIISSFIKPENLDKELLEAQESYPSKTVTPLKHDRMEVVKYEEQRFKSYNKKIESI